MVVLGECVSYVLVNEVYIVETRYEDMYVVVNILGSQIVYNLALRIFWNLRSLFAMCKLLD